MKQALTIVTLMLAINFLMAAGGAAWLAKAGHVDRAKIVAIKAVLFPPDAAAATQPATQPAAAPTPEERLNALVSRATGFTAAQRVSFVSQAFATQQAEVDRRQQELADLKRQVDLASAKLASDRAALTAEKQQAEAKEQSDSRLASDKGFQDSLALYQVMPGRQVKTIFMSLPDDVVEQYLRAMSPTTAKRIIKEYKTPDEVARIQTVMERLRTGDAAAAGRPPSNPGSATANAAAPPDDTVGAAPPASQ